MILTMSNSLLYFQVVIKKMTDHHLLPMNNSTIIFFCARSPVFFVLIFTTVNKIKK